MALNISPLEMILVGLLGIAVVAVAVGVAFAVAAVVRGRNDRES